ncbi:MAG: DNA-binding LytR/AlgR family response regulator [Lentisphaeria bacterium]|jgi:DNA-binding LytR/AlgR family response regulator
MMKRSINQMEKRFPTKNFIRVNRQYIVNIDNTVHIKTIEGGLLLLSTTSGAELELSRRQPQ